MTNREEVISKIEEEISLAEYWDEPYRTIDLQLLIDAIALLKEQNKPIKPTLNESHRYVSDAFKCGKCGHIIRFHAKYCEDCGQAVKWE